MISLKLELRIGLHENYESSQQWESKLRSCIILILEYLTENRYASPHLNASQNTRWLRYVNQSIKKQFANEISTLFERDYIKG